MPATYKGMNNRSVKWKSRDVAAVDDGDEADDEPASTELVFLTDSYLRTLPGSRSANAALGILRGRLIPAVK